VAPSWWLYDLIHELCDLHGCLYGSPKKIIASTLLVRPVEIFLAAIFLL
jgi:hypothetical protein